ncbi:hypothetical protein AB1Y20_011983 [Prymnesium parvum]|uniref:Uncharacterized protein n=1 Tax=Prymnesium parvum TaxID=97485 RepID=A0AB34IMW2_PRYPA
MAACSASSTIAYPLFAFTLATISEASASSIAIPYTDMSTAIRISVSAPSFTSGSAYPTIASTYFTFTLSTFSDASTPSIAPISANCAVPCTGISAATRTSIPASSIPAGSTCSTISSTLSSLTSTLATIADASASSNAIPYTGMSTTILTSVPAPNFTAGSAYTIASTHFASTLATFSDASTPSIAIPSTIAANHAAPYTGISASTRISVPAPSFAAGSTCSTITSTLPSLTSTFATIADASTPSVVFPSTISDAAPYTGISAAVRTSIPASSIAAGSTCSTIASTLPSLTATLATNSDASTPSIAIPSTIAANHAAPYTGNSAAVRTSVPAPSIAAGYTCSTIASTLPSLTATLATFSDASTPSIAIPSTIAANHAAPYTGISASTRISVPAPSFAAGSTCSTITSTLPSLTSTFATIADASTPSVVFPFTISGAAPYTGISAAVRTSIPASSIAAGSTCSTIASTLPSLTATLATNSDASTPSIAIPSTIAANHAAPYTGNSAAVRTSVPAPSIAAGYTCSTIASTLPSLTSTLATIADASTPSNAIPYTDMSTTILTSVPAHSFTAGGAYTIASTHFATTLATFSDASTPSIAILATICVIPNTDMPTAVRTSVLPRIAAGSTCSTLITSHFETISTPPAKATVPTTVAAYCVTCNTDVSVFSAVLSTSIGSRICSDSRDCCDF